MKMFVSLSLNYLYVKDYHYTVHCIPLTIANAYSLNYNSFKLLQEPISRSVQFPADYFISTSTIVNSSSRNGRFFTLSKLYYCCKIAMYYTTEATFLYNGEV